VELRTQDPSNLESLKNLVLAGLIEGDAHAAIGSMQSAIETWNQALTHLGTAPVVGQNPELIELSAALLLRLGHDGQAQPNLDLLDTMGYHPQFISLPETR